MLLKLFSTGRFNSLIRANYLGWDFKNFYFREIFGVISDFWIQKSKRVIWGSIACFWNWILKIRPVLMDEWYGWLNVGDNLSMLVTEYRCWWHILNVASKRQCLKKLDVGDKNGRNRRQHVEVATNTLRVKQPSPTSILPFSCPHSFEYVHFSSGYKYI